MDKMSLGDRMKDYYEKPYNLVLPMRMPVIIRLDGRAFHTLTRKYEKPFDPAFISLMQLTSLYLAENIQSTELVYTQSDEISLFLHNYKKLKTQAWFGNEIEKMLSISAGLASSFLSVQLNKPVQFDSRVFVLPENELCNYFIWRQQDWERNSIEMLAQSLYSHKDLHKKNCADLQELCWKKGHNWSKLPPHLKRGTCCIKQKADDDKRSKWIIDDEIPIFSKDRDYIESRLVVEDENKK